MPPPILRCMKRTLSALACATLLALSAKTEEPAPASAGHREFFRGMSDASAGVMLGTNYFAAGNDEDNRIRIFRLDSPGMPVRSVDCSGFLRVFGKNLETDLEGATRLGDRIFWISSHGENRHGHFAPNRRRLFATLVVTNNGIPSLQPVEQPYENLLDDLERDDRYRGFRLGLAALLPPKAPGGLNIEGLCATPDGQILIGFRNPIPNGKALIAPLLNPRDVIRGERGRFGAPVLLDLAGNGIRDIGWWRGNYYLLAGAFDPQSAFRLYEWAGPGHAPEMIPSTAFTNFNPEAIIFDDESNRVLVLSDDGTRKAGGVESKRLPDPAQRRFRATWMQLPIRQSMNLKSEIQSLRELPPALPAPPRKPGTTP